LLQKKRFSDALEVARGFNLAAGDGAVQARLVEDARRIDMTALDDASRTAVQEIKRLAGEAASKRARALSADRALTYIRRATEARAEDPRVKGRAVLLEPRGQV